MRVPLLSNIILKTIYIQYNLYPMKLMKLSAFFLKLLSTIKEVDLINIKFILTDKMKEHFI